MHWQVMHWGAWGGMHGFWFIGGLFWIAMLVLLSVGLIFWLNRRNNQSLYHSPDMPSDQPSAFEILNQRYARGEIDATTFEQMRERLEGSRGPKL